ncbi:TRAP transporter small permease [Afifella marina]|uniref:TRAP transporter small permease protein n=1 Tax=Afifella marina DSM 2698 TaxID=1120955 RepID=A0A1G5M2F8_AFIMA|nr:TRAP transporter small permease [Afifella marina]MBK1623071.1 TRAP transporter small permease [Afifella marina DSM 2698]MBK1626065.1 TRAP transporter small permease [Afifella marina]MBK5917889.1 C4-dicarboxylate ABC transporter [Afifella marina]RAI18177.1 C4-dicarboxylate ABC transporter [Afifella marina DSM 2698]SCZ19352.1 C4-dicarboxylate transporter, DctQ subunit [Afifella marina DSM 2698]
MSSFGRRVDRFERSVIAILMAAMTVTSFTQVIARYVFNTGWLGALDFARILFAWLILFGMAYGAKIGSHLAVDTLVRALPARLFKAFAIFGALCGVVYAAIFFWADWLQFVGIDAKGGAFPYWLRTFETGIGLTEIRYPDWAQEMFDLPARVHRWIAYLILPLGLFLFGFRCLQALIEIVQGKREMITTAIETTELMDQRSDPDHESYAAAQEHASEAPHWYDDNNSKDRR